MPEYEIKENIVHNGAFYGRRSMDVVLKELPLDQCVQFWGPHGNTR